VTPEDWAEWQESCRKLAKANHERGYHHAAAALRLISETRFMYCDVPLANVTEGTLRCVSEWLKEQPAELYVRIWRAQMEHWLAVFGGGPGEGAYMNLSEANALAASGRLAEALTAGRDGSRSRGDEPQARPAP
jgi:hypothetical protein